MSDTIAHFTSDGYIAPGDASATFNIHLASGTISKANATYMFEINTVMHSTAGCETAISRDIMWCRRLSSVTETPRLANVASLGSGLAGDYISISAAPAGSGNYDLVVTILNTTAWDYSRYWRVWVTAYVKDNVI
jgi:hypothetical protein